MYSISVASSASSEAGCLMSRTTHSGVVQVLDIFSTLFCLTHRRNSARAIGPSPGSVPRVMISTTLVALAALRITTDARSINEQDMTYCSAPASISRGPDHRALQLSACVAQIDIDVTTYLINVISRLSHFEVPPPPSPLKNKLHGFVAWRYD